MTAIFVIAELLLSIVFLLILFFVMVPAGLKTYEQWTSTRKPRDLASVVILAFFVLYLTAVTAINLICLFIKFKNDISYGVNSEIVGAALLLFVYYFTIPKVVVSFRQWKLTKQHKPFSKMVVSSVLTLYSFAIVFTIFIPKLIPF